MRWFPALTLIFAGLFFSSLAKAQHFDTMIPFMEQVESECTRITPAEQPAFNRIRQHLNANVERNLRGLKPLEVPAGFETDYHVLRWHKLNCVHRLISGRASPMISLYQLESDPGLKRALAQLALYGGQKTSEAENLRKECESVNGGAKLNCMKKQTDKLINALTLGESAKLYTQAMGELSSLNSIITLDQFGTIILDEQRANIDAANKKARRRPAPAAGTGGAPAAR